MDRSLIAVLISALVVPGAGHFYLKRAGRGLLFLVPTLAALGYFLSVVMERASALVDEVISGKLELDPVALAARLEQQGAIGSPLMTLCIWVMIGCWVGAMVDCYLLARRQAADKGRA